MAVPAGEQPADLNRRNSRKALDNALELFGGQKFTLVNVEFTEPVEEYPGFKLHLGTRVIARRPSDGKVGELPVLDAIVEMGGRWRLLNFDEWPAALARPTAP